MLIDKNARACLTTAIVLLFVSTALILGDSTVSSKVSSASASTGGITLYPWPMFQHNLNNTGYTDSPAPKTNALFWNTSVGSVASGGPTVANGIVYTAGTTSNPDVHYVHALNMSTGEELWNIEATAIVRCAPAVADGMVYVGSESGVFYALNATTGAEEWTYSMAQIARSHPTVVDGIVYIGDYNGYVYALNAATGALVWSYDTTDKVRGSPAVVDGTLYIGSASDMMYALNAATGAYIWSFTTPSDVRCSPAVVDGKVYFGNQDGIFYCLDAASGSKIWNYTTGFSIFSSPAVAYGLVFIGSNDYTLYAFDMDTGDVVWSYLMNTDGLTDYASPTVADGLVFMGSKGDILYCLNATAEDLTDEERLVWSVDMGGDIRGPCAIADGFVFAGSFKADVGGELCAFGTSLYPVANFTFSPAFARPDQVVTFDASDSYDLTRNPLNLNVNYTWDFDDGNVTTVTVPTITHSYAEEKTYNVTLTVTGNATIYGTTTKEVIVTTEGIYYLTAKVLWSNGSAIEGANVTVGTSTGSTNASGLVPFLLLEGNYAITVEYDEITLLNTTIYLNTDTTVTCTVDSEPFETIAELDAEIEAARNQAANNTYIGIGGGVGIGVVVGLAVMFAMKRS